MQKSRKKTTVLNITSRCNLACGFCFGPENTRSDEMSESEFRYNNKFRSAQFVTPELLTQQAKNLILKLKKSSLPTRQAGAGILIFSGGEPLLRKDIWELICFAKKLGFFTVLHTNGMLLNRMTLCKLIVAAPFRVRNNRRLPDIKSGSPLRFEKPAATKLKPCLDQINLPLDGYNAKTNDAMRCRGHFKKIMEALKLLRNSKIRVIISTVATAKNKDAIAKIGKILPSWVHKWRIFQFNPQSKAAAMKKEFAISDGEFEEISRQARNLTKKSRFKVQCVGVKDRGFWEGYTLI